MLEKIKSFGKGLKKMVDKEINLVKEYLAQAQNRLILGLLFMGLGGGLVASAYLKAK